MASINNLLRPAYHSARSLAPGTRTFATTTHRRQTIPFEVTGKGKGVAQIVQVKNSHHEIKADAYPAFGGQDAAPSPLHYNLTSLSTCTQVTGSLVAKGLGIDLKGWNVSVDGRLDPGVLVEGVEGNANWRSIELRVEVVADVEEGVFRKFASETERRCPVTQLFKRSGVEWKSEWTKK
ncbi:OsmC/Ohr family [Neohortaea acidophila]|uniref:OsmC/Ohr family n=1 Tax=Neohortaea acidophila TaxID=245834 RepID=A0A6A6PYY3_9PEZI|nr:OsmC/Ohr family [Neohortaea acidophila]KAF2485225.1 OsmC/Ohr family [Neohortaea acidophila]